MRNERLYRHESRQQEKEEERLEKEMEAKKVKAEKEQEEQEEFKKWKHMFSVDEEGEDAASVRDETAVQRFVDYVKLRKVVNLEDLAAEFQIRTAAAIDRLQHLEKLDRVSGIFDDRGKYIYVTKEEMASVADWLKMKGRISRTDLVAACNRLIRLNPTKDDEVKLQAEAKLAEATLEATTEEGTVPSS